MDPVSHLLFARMLAALRSPPALAPGVVAATVLGGMAPDADSVLVAFGWDVYLLWHQSGTHALIGTLAVAMVTALLVRLRHPGTSMRPLVAGAWTGALSHVVFDLVSGGTIRVLWPLSDERFSVPLVAMADPIILVIMLVGAAALWVWPRVPRLAAFVAMTLLILALAGKFTSRHWATHAYAAHVGAAHDDVVLTDVEAGWGSWRRWSFFDRLGDGRVRAWAVDAWTGRVDQRFEITPRDAAPFARSSLRQFATARNFDAVHAYAFATHRGTDDGAVVFWSDARFCWPAAERADPQEGAPHQDVRPAVGPIRCAMWFGGSLDAAGQPHEALVWLGGHLQRRQP